MPDNDSCEEIITTYLGVTHRLQRLLRPKVLRVVLAGMFVPLALVAYWPGPVDQPVQLQLAVVLYVLHEYGLPLWINYASIEASANVALFTPIGFASALAFPFKRWWLLCALGLGISACMEIGQLLFLSRRVASPLDLMTNVTGFALGIFCAIRTVKKLPALNRSGANFYD